MRNRAKSPSPQQISHIRTTRVASVSPAGTLVGSAPPRGRRGRPESVGADWGNGSRIGSESVTSRWRSESRTVRDSLDEQVDDDRGRRGRKRTQGWAASLSRSRSRQPPKGPVADQSAAATKEDVEAVRSTGQPPAEHQDLVVRLLPHPIPHFLGYRRPLSQVNAKHRHIKPYPSILPFVHRIPLLVESIVWTWIGAFVGISAVSLIFARPNHFATSDDLPAHAWMSPVIIGSFGASSVLLYAAPSSPLGQPRSFVGGQFFSALTGVCVTKLFRLSMHYNIDLTNNSASLVWLAGSVSTATALVVMMVTGTLHPPGGATALLCATNSQVERLGWKVIPVVLLSSIVMLVWSLLWMNLGRRRYPENFFAPSPVDAKGGNVSIAIYEALCNRLQPKGTKGKGELPPAKLDMADKAIAPVANVAGDDPWQDEGGWDNIAEEEGSGPEDAGFERPSRRELPL